jgi:conjugal transfer pilus assembly protein TraF
MRGIKILMFLVLVPITCYGQGFFEQRYRGWLWFEEKERLAKEQLEEQLAEEDKKEEYAKARAEVEQFAKELEELKFMMIRYPENIEHVFAYRKKEGEMLDNALKLADTSRMVNFLYPNLFNHIDNPINLYGKRIKEEIDQTNQTQKITELAGKIELFLFFANSCKYCQVLEPILNDFAKKYGFKVEAVSLDGGVSKYFKTHQDKDGSIARLLNLQKTPTIVAVTNDSLLRFELIRGVASVPELEEASLLAIDYLDNQDKLKMTKHEK